MHPIPTFILEKVLSSLIHEGAIQDYYWRELKYTCHPTLIESLEELEASVQRVDFSNLPELKGTEKQISYAASIREKALRAEAALQKVLVGSKIMRFYLFPPIKHIDQSTFWIENRQKLTRKVEYTVQGSVRPIPLYKIPDDTPAWVYKDSFQVWQNERLNYIWETTEPELEILRDPAVVEAVQQ